MFDMVAMVVAIGTAMAENMACMCFALCNYLGCFIICVLLYRCLLYLHLE